jgi:hypothetical protein
VSSERGTSMNVIFHAGTDSTVRCNTYPDTTPILCLDGTQTSVMISATSRDVTPEGVEFARALAQQAQCYAAEMERLHAEHFGPPADSNAA